MFLVNVTAETINQVVAHSKYASTGLPKKADIGDIILIAQTKMRKGEKSIKHTMRYDGFYEDTKSESLSIWGKDWRYIIRGTDIQPVEPFNMQDVQKREKPYRFRGSNYLYVDEADAVAVENWIAMHSRQAPSLVYPDELSPPPNGYSEGKMKPVVVNVYERNAQARQTCISHYGAICSICGFSSGTTYGAENEGLIHVHHLKMLSEITAEYAVDPIDDLRPVCPNCHMVLHSKKDGCFSLDEVRAMLRKAAI